MKSLRTVIISAVPSLLLTSPAWAIWVSATSYAFFETQGNSVGALHGLPIWMPK